MNATFLVIRYGGNKAERIPLCSRVISGNRRSGEKSNAGVTGKNSMGSHMKETEENKEKKGVSLGGRIRIEEINYKRTSYWGGVYNRLGLKVLNRGGTNGMPSPRNYVRDIGEPKAGSRGVLLSSSRNTQRYLKKKKGKENKEQDHQPTMDEGGLTQE